MGYMCKILADSLNEATDDRLTTFEVSYPRIILAEVNTHRKASRNARSSRATPVQIMIKDLMDDPFVPTYWGKNQKGMQAETEVSPEDAAWAVLEWLAARDHALEHAKNFLDRGFHKQLANRLLEPWAWTRQIISATEWKNFFALRTHKDAQPEFQVIARMMLDAYRQSRPIVLQPGDWHLPLTNTYEKLSEPNQPWHKISAGRCARVSYLTHDGKRDLQADIDLCDGLTRNGHMSPLEHPAFAMGKADEIMSGNYTGFVQYRKMIPNEAVWINPQAVHGEY